MGYYTIFILPAIQDMTMIIYECGNFDYNHLPVAMCASGNIFQAKVDDRIIDIKGVKTYIGDILVLIKENFSNHIEQLRVIFGRLRAEGLNCNAPKCSFVFKYIPYLGYAIKMEDINLTQVKNKES